MENKRINYIDLGLHLGFELEEMLIKIFPFLNLHNVKAHGFEASSKFANHNREKYSKFIYLDVDIYHAAISNSEEPVKLYKSNPAVSPVADLGNSIFKSKKNVSDKYETVPGVIFSNWLKKKVPNYKKEVNILKVNIEGAEYHLFKDMVENDLLQYFPLIMGAGHDVDKVPELDSEEYWKLIKDNNITIHRFCSDFKRDKNAYIPGLIQDAVMKHRC